MPAKPGWEMIMDNVRALSVLDGRYEKATRELKEAFSEYGLIRHRVIVEIKWLEFMTCELNLIDLDESGIEAIIPARRAIRLETS